MDSPPFVNTRDEAIAVMLSPTGSDLMYVLESLAREVQEGEFNWVQTGSYRMRAGKHYLEFRRLADGERKTTRKVRAVPGGADDDPEET
jgi:hypothetical protein